MCYALSRAGESFDSTPYRKKFLSSQGSYLKNPILNSLIINITTKSFSSTNLSFVLFSLVLYHFFLLNLILADST